MKLLGAKRFIRTLILPTHLYTHLITAISHASLWYETCFNIFDYHLDYKTHFFTFRRFRQIVVVFSCCRFCWLSQVSIEHMHFSVFSIAGAFTSASNPKRSLCGNIDQINSIGDDRQTNHQQHLTLFLYSCCISQSNTHTHTFAYIHLRHPSSFLLFSYLLLWSSFVVHLLSALP